MEKYKNYNRLKLITINCFIIKKSLFNILLSIINKKEKNLIRKEILKIY
jgi:hypothetical protein